MILKIDHNSPVPLHAQVEQLLRQLIEMDEYKKGGLLPKEVDLAKTLGVSRNTVRQATNKLENEGLLARKKGVGTRAVMNSINTNLGNWHSFTQEMNSKGIRLINYHIKSSLIAANDKIAEFMRIKKGTKLVKISRIKGDKSGPFVFFESFIHPRVGMKISDDFSQPLYEIMETKYATFPANSEEHISAAVASKTIAEKLGIKTGLPVLKRERFVYDPGNRPVEYNIGYYRADKFTYSINIKR